jgi:hypothetical protein
MPRRRCLPPDIYRVQSSSLRIPVKEIGSSSRLVRGGGARSGAVSWRIMTYALHTFLTTLLSSTPDVHLDKVTVEQDTVRLQLTATAPHAYCSGCALPSSAAHSRYQRHLTDLRRGVCPVSIQLTLRKFMCRNAAQAGQSDTSWAWCGGSSVA